MKSREPIPIYCYYFITNGAKFPYKSVNNNKKLCPVILALPILQAQLVYSLIYLRSDAAIHLHYYCCRFLLRIAIRPMHRITTPKIREATALLLNPATRYVKKETTATVMA